MRRLARADAVRAQLVFALLLELCRHVGLQAAATRAGEWSCAPDFSFWKKADGTSAA